MALTRSTNRTWRSRLRGLARRKSTQATAMAMPTGLPRSILARRQRLHFASRTDASRFDGQPALRPKRGAPKGGTNKRFSGPAPGKAPSSTAPTEAEQQTLDPRLRDPQFCTRSLIESNIDALMTTDLAGITFDVNKPMEALTGCTRDELIGAPFKYCFTDPQRAEAVIAHELGENKATHDELVARCTARVVVTGWRARSRRCGAWVSEPCLADRPRTTARVGIRRGHQAGHAWHQARIAARQPFLSLAVSRLAADGS